MKKNVLYNILYLICLVSLFNLSIVSSAYAQLFQNNNTSCEEHVVVGQVEPPPFDAFGNPYMSVALACGNLEDFNNSGNTNFADCITQRSPLPTTMSPIASNSFLVNTEAHGDNCINAGEANAQFEDSITLSNEAFNSETDIPMEMGTIRAGNLGDNPFEDIAFVNRSNIASPIEPSIQYLFSENQGGFLSSFTPLTVDIDNNLVQQPFTYPAYFFGSTQIASDRSLLLMNCDADPVDEAIVAVQFDFLNVGFLVSQNQGAGLQDVQIDGIFFLPTVINETSRVVLTEGDFNQDGILDIAAAVNTRGNGDDEVVFCAGDGACGFDCPENSNDPKVFNLTQACDLPNCTPYPSSISAGDFNSDGLMDLALAESRSSQVRYLFNNNGNGANGQLANWQTTVFDFSNLNSMVLPLVVTAGHFSVEAYQTNTQELAVTLAEFVPDLDGIEEASSIQVITSDGQGNLQNPSLLTFAQPDSTAVSGIESSDFDHCGGDDLIALAHTTDELGQITRQASIFLNTNEAPEAFINQDIDLQDASAEIQASCNDPTRDDRSFEWSVIVSPDNAELNFSVEEGQLIGEDTETSTVFQTNQSGDYTIRFSCTDFCGLVSTREISFTITVPDVPDTSTDTGEPEVEVITQGGCVASIYKSNKQESMLIYAVIFLISIGWIRSLRKIN